MTVQAASGRHFWAESHLNGRDNMYARHHSKGGQQVDSCKRLPYFCEKKWACCECSQHAALSLWIVNCPGCQHLLCTDCPLEKVKIPSHERNSKVRDPTKLKDPLDSLELVNLIVVSEPRKQAAERTTITPSQRLSINSVSSIISLNSSRSLIKSPTTICSATPSGTFISSETDSGIEGSDTYHDDHIALNLKLADLDLLFQACQPKLYSLLRYNVHLVTLLLPRIYRFAKLLITNHISVPTGFVAPVTTPGPIGQSNPLCKEYWSSSGAELIRQKYSETADTTQPQGAQNTSNQPVGGSIAITPAGQTNHEPQASRPRKRGRSPDEPGRPGGSFSTKKSRHDLADSFIVNFACHFHKKDPMKYGPCSPNKKYRNCGAVTIPSNRLSRIKDHYKSAHRLPQCNRCYEIFNNSALLVAHQEQVPCHPGPRELKEGIDDGQWDVMEMVLKRKGKTEIEKWYEIWTDVLFRGATPPSSPWNEPQTVITSSAPDLATLMSVFEHFLEEIIQEADLQVDSTVFDAFINAASRAYIQVTRSGPSSGQQDSPAEESQKSSHEPLESGDFQKAMKDQNLVVLEEQQVEMAMLDKNNYGAFDYSFGGTSSTAFDLYNPQQAFQNFHTTYPSRTSGGTSLDEALISPIMTELLPYEATENISHAESVLTDEMISQEAIYFDGFLDENSFRSVKTSYQLDNMRFPGQVTEMEDMIPSHGIEFHGDRMMEDGDFTDMLQNELESRSQFRSNKDRNAGLEFQGVGE